MNKKLARLLTVSLPTAAILSLTACTTTQPVVDNSDALQPQHQLQSESQSQKTSKSKVRFPDPKDSYLHEWPRYEVEDVVKVGYGINDDTVRSAIGNPHFSEFDSKTWNYLVGLRQPNTLNYAECQLQIHFDDKGIVDRMYWNSKVCPNIINETLKPPEPRVVERVIVEKLVEAPPQVEIRRFALSTDILFEFDSSQLKSNAQYEIQKLLNQVNREFQEVQSIDLVGNTDRFGDDDYNQKLGFDRANAVKGALVSTGIPEGTIAITSRGENNPVTNGCYGMSAAQAKACLAPDRRVDVVVSGILKNNSALK